MSGVFVAFGEIPYIVYDKEMTTNVLRGNHTVSCR